MCAGCTVSHHHALQAEPDIIAKEIPSSTQAGESSKHSSKRASRHSSRARLAAEVNDTPLLGFFEEVCEPASSPCHHRM